MSISDAGTKVDEIVVTIGPQFLNLFSEHLYSSPNKAFEELVSNSWDAGASRVCIHVPDDLSDETSAIWVLDNGVSMDVEGLKALWAVATSNKRSAEVPGSRKPIGKFGVGKLATYLLAHELTYICRAADGLIRIVTMDYREIERRSSNTLHIDPLPLDVRQVENNEIEEIISVLPNNSEIYSKISNDFNDQDVDNEFTDEFGGEESPHPNSAGTWTLAVLTSLKGQGKNLKTGWIRRLLRTALPLGRSITITFNEELLSSAKSSKEVTKEWMLGPGIGLGTLSLPSGDQLSIEEKNHPFPHISIDSIGPVSGKIKLYEEKISGGKSEDIEVSNGFFVNIRGRVLKPEDPYFGLGDVDELTHVTD